MRQNGTPVSHHSTHILSHIEQKVNTNGIQKTHVSFQITLTRYGLKVKKSRRYTYNTRCVSYSG